MQAKQISRFMAFVSVLWAPPAISNVSIASIRNSGAWVGADKGGAPSNANVHIRFHTSGMAGSVAAAAGQADVAIAGQFSVNLNTVILSRRRFADKGRTVCGRSPPIPPKENRSILTTRLPL